MQQQVDWSVLRKSLPDAERRKFNWLCSEIRHCKQTIEILQGFRLAVAISKVQCEKHWIAACYECSTISRIDALLRKARKELAILKFRLISLPTVAQALGRTQAGAEAVSFGDREAVESRLENERHPIERMYGKMKTGTQETDSRLRRSDVDDNIRLIESWLKGRSQAA